MSSASFVPDEVGVDLYVFDIMRLYHVGRHIINTNVIAIHNSGHCLLDTDIPK